MQALQHRSTLIYVMIMIPMLLTCFVYQYGDWKTDNEIIFHSNADYLIYSPQCQLPDLSAWNPDAKKLYKKASYVTCSKYQLLTKLVLSDNNTVVTLIVDKKLAPKYAKDGLTCCVSEILRENKTETKIKYTTCHPIANNSAQVSNELPVRVTCRSQNKKKQQVYQNVHQPMAITSKIQEKIANFQAAKTDKRPLSVLIIGIDSISRLNMIRTMPKTRTLLLNNPDWLEYKIYHKIEDNTFPNLMAMLTGLNNSDAYAQCNPKEYGGIDKCDFMWRRYHRHHYVTAYVEDSALMSTFNYAKKGFKDPPTDYYTRSYQMACADLTSKRVDDTAYCTGPEMEGERVWRLARDFAKLHSQHPYFGFFWMNTYSHQQLNTPTRLDGKIREYMEDITKLADDNTVILFLSDHGLRFGQIRHTLTGYLEERLPFLFVKFPKWFHEQFPHEYANIKANSDKLVTPYDIYMTLQDTLKYAGFDYTVRKAAGCANCHSLFEPVSTNRSCASVDIPTHWCTCLNYVEQMADGTLGTRAADALVARVHEIIAERNATDKCQRYTVDNVMRVYRSKCLDGRKDCGQNLLVVIVETRPAAIFEATFSLTWQPRMPGRDETVDGGDLDAGVLNMYTGISRLNSYSHSGRCTNDGYLKLLCYCK